MRNLHLLALVAVVLLPAPTVHADTAKCRLGVIKASAAYARTRLAARERCEDARLQGKVAACPDPKQIAALAKADAKLGLTLGKACGGKNKTCNAADTGVDADDAPSAIGFPATCPSFTGRVCGQTVTACGDIAPCLHCVTDPAVEDTVDLVWSETPAILKTARKCQRAVGRASGALFAAVGKARQRCWEAVSQGKIAGPCPVPGDGKTAATIAKATAKHANVICKACGGGGDRAPADGQCDAPGPFDLDALGLPPVCPDVAVPGGAACGGAVAGVAALPACHACATTFAATCIDALAVHAFQGFPFECGGQAITFVDALVDGIDGVDGLASPFGIAISPDGKHVYVGGQSDDAVAVFARNAATGRLTFLERKVNGAGGVQGLGGVVALTVSPDGAHVYTAGIDGGVAAFVRNPVSGVLTFVEAEIDGQGGVDGLGFARAVTVAPDGAHVYVAGLGDDAVVVFSRNATSGALTFLGTVQDGVGGVDGIDGAVALAFSPDGTTLYVAGSTDHAIAVFTRNPTSGALTFAEMEKDGVGNVNGLFGVRALTVSADGSHLYAASALPGAIVTFARDGTSGLLTFQDQLQDGEDGADGLSGVGPLAVSANGTTLVAVAEQDSSLVTFGRDPATGALTFRAAVFDGNGAEGIESADGLVLSPDGKHAYVAGFNDDAVAIFALQ